MKRTRWRSLISCPLWKDWDALHILTLLTFLSDICFCMKDASEADWHPLRLAAPEEGNLSVTPGTCIKHKLQVFSHLTVPPALYV